MKKSSGAAVSQNSNPNLEVSSAMRLCVGLAVLLLLLLKVTNLFGAQGEEVMFASGKLMLHGFLYRPKGSGPFPAVLYDLGPSRTWPASLSGWENRNKLLIFPRYGDTHQEGHGVFCKRGGNVWGAQVFSFLEGAMGK